MLSNVIKRFKTGSRGGIYYVTRRTAPTIGSDGIAIPGATTKLRITASVQPVSQNLLQVFPDGLRIEDSSVIYTATPLLATDRSGTIPDLIDLDGVTYEVIHVHGPWQLGRSVHYEVLLAKQSRGGSS